MDCCEKQTTENRNRQVRFDERWNRVKKLQKKINIVIPLISKSTTFAQKVK